MPQRELLRGAKLAIGYQALHAEAEVLREFVEAVADGDIHEAKDEGIRARAAAALIESKAAAVLAGGGR